MADGKTMEVVEGETTAAAAKEDPASTTPKPVFLVNVLDHLHQRQQVLTKVQEFLAAG